MKFCILSEEEFKKFAAKHEQESYFQTVETANLRKLYGSKIHFLGVKENGNIIMASMFTETNTLAKKKTFYAPRGYLMDYHNKELLSFFTKNLVEYVKKHNAMMIKIDPNVIYRRRDINGNICEDRKADDETVSNLKSIGYHHYGFNKDIGFIQSRWNFLLELDVPYEQLKNKFSKSTRKNIDFTYKRGLQVRVANKSDLKVMEDILVETANRKKFKNRSLEYYERMYDCMGDLLRIYIAYIEPKKYIECSKELLKNAEKEYEIVLEKMKKDMVGNKLNKQQESALKQIEKCKEELNDAMEFSKKYPEGKDIGVLISLKSGREYLTLYSGFLVEFRKFTPKYAMYNEHILDAYKFKIPIVNFYGITGIFNSSDKNYGMYEFKRGFGGEVVELIGEFSYPTSYIYYFYNILRKFKRIIRKLFNISQ